MIEENNNREGDSCSYIFQLKTPLMCTANNASTTTSASTVTTAGNAATTTTEAPVRKASKLGFVGVVLLV